MSNDEREIFDVLRSLLGEEEPLRDTKPEPPPKDRVDVYRVQELVKKIEVHSKELNKAFDDLRKNLQAAAQYMKDVPELRGAMDVVLRSFSEVKSMDFPSKLKDLNNVLNLLDQAARVQRSKIASVSR